MSTQYKPNILIVGPSGSGKTTSWGSCDPEDTFIIDTELKGFPFNVSKFKHIESVTNLGEFCAAIAKANASPCSVCIIDSGSGYLELNRDLARGTKTGWDVWNLYNSNFNKHVIKNIQSTSKIWVLIGHEEPLKIISPDGEEKTSLRFKVQGREWEGQVETKFLVVLFSTARKLEGKLKYQFITNADGITTAKSPAPLQLPLYMDNNLSKIITRIKEVL